jgi:hypothetical protein
MDTGLVYAQGEVMMSRVCLLLVLLLLSLGLRPSRPASGQVSEPLAGIHTIRAEDDLLQLARDAGFAWIIQLLSWQEVEPVPGEFFWEYSDWLVRAVEYYGLDLVLRLDQAPDWADPDDPSQYANFVREVASRYRGRIVAYVVWNEPNLAVEWAGRAPDPAGYVELLCAARAAIRAADPQALIVSAGLASTNHADASALDDRVYLEAMYAAGAARCFDILGAHPYGFAYPPHDPSGAHDDLNVARLEDLRAVMVGEGDAAKPVWATELGWTTAPVQAGQAWLAVSEAEQAEYLGAALDKAGRDWPWLERIAIWNLSRDLPAGDEKRGYSLLSSDGSPKPAYRALAEMLGGRRPNEPAGPVPASVIEILAPDVAVRLSDVDTFYPHWARPHCGSVPCRRWSGQFYVREPGADPWQLHIEIMQVEEAGNLVWINGHLLEPPAIPLRGRPDYTSVWTASGMSLPASLLRTGVNTIEIRSSPRLPVYQVSQGRFESLQFRHLRLLRDS